MIIRATCPEFRLLSAGVNLKHGEEATLPDDAKWQARAEFWKRQGLIEVLDASAKEGKKKKRSKAQRRHQVKKEAEPEAAAEESQDDQSS